LYKNGSRDRLRRSSLRECRFPFVGTIATRHIAAVARHVLADSARGGIGILQRIIQVMSSRTCASASASAFTLRQGGGTPGSELPSRRGLANLPQV
jgi:hypothetical protein